MLPERYNWLKGVWKGIRPVMVGVATYFLAEYQSLIPPEYLTPGVVCLFETVRNRWKFKRK